MKQFRKSLFIFVSLFMVLSLVVAACGDDDDDDDDGGDTNGGSVATEATNGGGAAETEEGGETGGGDADAAAAGEEIYNAQCASCHSTDGSEGIGPTWQGLWMSEVALESGETVIADEEYISESITDPNAKIVEGYSQGIMPSFDLSDEEIDQIIAFIQTL